MKKFLICTFVLVLCGITSVWAGGNRQLKFVPQMMSPMSFPVKDVSPDYFIKVNGDTLDCYLPYMGEAYTAPIDNDGLNFKTVIKNYEEKTVTKKKSTKRVITFEARKNGVESFHFQLTIWDNENADLFLLPSNAQSISYTGEMVPFEEKEKKK